MILSLFVCICIFTVIYLYLFIYLFSVTSTDFVFELGFYATGLLGIIFEFVLCTDLTDFMPLGIVVKTAHNHRLFYIKYCQTDYSPHG
uniref:Uncharacterized protein n=1 Tax=Anguilla anguilla TaxID=7936 RepID=A0A0E9WI51_ANGAN